MTIQQIQKLKNKLVRMIDADAPTKDINKLQKYIIREENLIIKKQNQNIKKLERENAKLRKKNEKKAEKQRIKVENNTHLYHVGFYLYIQSDKIYDENGNRKYPKLYNYADPNTVLILDEHQDDDGDNVRLKTCLAGETNLLKKYINNFVSNQLYFYLSNHAHNVKSINVINTIVNVIADTNDDFKRRIERIRISHDIIGVKFTFIEIVWDVYNPPEIMEIQVEEEEKGLKVLILNITNTK